MMMKMRAYFLLRVVFREFSRFHFWES